MSDQYKPQGFHGLECQYEIEEIARLNAALAAERERLKAATEQLAAERDDRISWQELYEKTNAALAAALARIGEK